ncbi:MAG TPA: amidase family protein, partial [Polyangiaceae bacterium]|nr:amidase family protein [Polyangiaceae bacterium]
MTARYLPDLHVLAAEYRNGTRRCQDVVEAAIAGRNASFDPVGPYRSWDADMVLQHAHLVSEAFRLGWDAGPLQGIPVSFKDLFACRGWRTFAGMAEPLSEDWEAEGTFVKNVRKQLPIVMGKTHTVELAFGGLGTNAHWGTPWNPWDRKVHRVPGGSSSGAGISLWEGSCLLAFGTDTAGSVRIPASMTGMAGLKTTVKRWPTDGVVPLSPSFDSVGILARSVRDLAFAYEAIEAGLGRMDRVRSRDLVGVRLAVPRRFFCDNLSDGIDTAFEAGLHALESAGAVLVPFETSPAEQAYSIFVQGGLAGVEALVFIEEFLPERMNSLDPFVRDRIVSAASTPASEYLRRRHAFERLGKITWEAMESVDAIVTPTVALSAPAVSELQSVDSYRSSNLLALRNTSIANL